MTEKTEQTAWRSGVDTTLGLHKGRIDGHDARLEKSVSKDEFTPVRIVVYGMCSTIGAAVIAAVLRLVILTGH